MSREANEAVLALVRKLAALSVDRCLACRRLWIVHSDAQLRSCAIDLRCVHVDAFRAALAEQVRATVAEQIARVKKASAA